MKNIGIIGCGAIGRLHAKNLRQRAKLTYCSRSPASAERFATEFGGSVCPSFEALLERPELDAVIISSPPQYHCDQVVAALRAGKAVLAENARKALFNLGGVLRNIGNQIGINGHTDPAPPTGSDYTSNWELSMGRATAVANALMRAGYTEDIVAFGYADSRFKELPDMPAAERRTLGRRVDIVVFPTVGEF